MKKILKRYGKTLVVSFTKEEEKAQNLKEGDFVDVEKFQEDPESWIGESF